MNVLLMGLRGSGKSTVGRRLAELLGCPFVDLDERVLATFAETSVRQVWSARGEGAWRAGEARVLAETLDAPSQVVALGGGTPMIDAARKRIEAEKHAGRAKAVYLRCETGELARRLRDQLGDRPPLTGRDPVDEIDDVLAAREPTFKALADLELDLTATSAEDAAEALRQVLGPAKSE